MQIKQKERCLFGLILSIILTLNAISFIYQSTNPLPPTPTVRAMAGNAVMMNLTGGENTENLGYIDDDNISLLWFVHVTDLHIPKEPTSNESVKFGEFLNTSYYQIQPFTVISTGDHVTGQRPGDLLSVNSKLLPEFQQYFSVVNASPYATDPNPYRYIEVVGNHDRNVDRDAKLFFNYTLSGQRIGTAQKFFVANLTRGEVLFNCLDSGGPMEAPSIPFGSEGNFDKEDIGEYEQILETYREIPTKFSFQHHHPLLGFGLSKNGKSAISLNQEYQVDAVFYGHSHMTFYETWDDTVWLMSDRFRDEYGTKGQEDYATNYFKIITVDNNGVNYIDTPLSDSQRAIITNPSNPLFLDKNDPIKNTRGDGHVRTLIFEDPADPIQLVEYRIDDQSWKPMQQYSNSLKLYESPRIENGNPYTAIPDDGKTHTIEVRIQSVSGKILTQSAESTSTAIRKPFFSVTISLIGMYYAIIFIIMNRDNLPLKRSDGTRRRLSHQEKVAKRINHNQDKNKSWWLPVFGLSLLFSFVFLPWGILPIFQGHLGIIYTWGIISSIGITSTIEPLLYQIVKLIVILPNLYWSIRTYHPNGLQFIGLLTMANSIFILQFNIKNFGVLGLWSPMAWFDLIISTFIIALQMRDTHLGKLLLQKKK